LSAVVEHFVDKSIDCIGKSSSSLLAFGVTVLCVRVVTDGDRSLKRVQGNWSSLATDEMLSKSAASMLIISRQSLMLLLKRSPNTHIISL